MAQVVDTKGNIRDARKNNNVVRGSSRGGNLVKKTNQLEANTNFAGNDFQDQYSKPSVRSDYVGISGGIPIPKSDKSISSSPSLTPSSPSSLLSDDYQAKKNDYFSLHDSAFMQDKQDEQNNNYEKFFRSSGLSEEDLDDIRSHGSLLDSFSKNPAVHAATDNLMFSNPWSNVSINDLQVPDYEDESGTGSIAKDTMRFFSESMFDEDGNYKEPNTPEKYRKTTKTSTGDLTAVDDGTLDYDHLTANRVTGDRMQDYLELGAGGRNYWEYDPYRIYLKTDEASHHNYSPYVPDDITSFNLKTTGLLDEPSDLAGTLADARTRGLPSAKIKYDIDGDANTTDDILTLDYNDFDYRDEAYWHNINKLTAENPEIFTNRPQNDEIHGAPITPTIRENKITDINGDTVYAYGNMEDISFDNYIVQMPDGTTISIPISETNPDENMNPTTLPSWVPEEALDGNWSIGSDYYNIKFSDGSVVKVPTEEYDSWWDDAGYANSETYPGKDVSIYDASGTLPEDLDSLNDRYRQDRYNPEENTWMDFPVHYLPDMVMEDGTRITYPQFLDIYGDVDRADKSPNDFAGTNVAYDYNLLNKPKALMKNGGQLINSDASNPIDALVNANWDDFVPATIDMTLGSLPISFDKVAWPLSVTQALSKSMSGLEANGYDSLTDSDMYMSAEIDEDTGKLIPTTSDVNKVAAIAGNSLIPLTENIAGNVSGRSFIPALSGDIPDNPTLNQLFKAWLLGNVGEGIEELPGNIVDEFTMYGDSAYGIPIDPETGERLVDRRGWYESPSPVMNADGTYKFVDENGEPLTEIRDEMNHIYKDPNTGLYDRVLNFLDPTELANAFAGGFSVGGTMSLPNTLLIPKAYTNTRYLKQTGLPQYIKPEMDERKPVDVEAIKRYLSDRGVE